jgi:hypothetical protein
LTTIITVAGTVLPPGQTAAILTANSNLTIAALPAAHQYFTTPACSTIIDFYCFHLQLNQHLTNFKEQFIIAIKSRVELLIAFMTAKENTNFKLTKQL